MSAKVSAKVSTKVPFMRSCLQECSDTIETTVTGIIPDWINGTLIRNGCGLQEVGPDRYKHAFDGLALLHRFRISDGRVEYQNRFLRSDAYVKNMRAQRIVVSEFGTRAQADPCQSIWQRLASRFIPSSSSELTDNDAVNVYPVGDRLYAATETNFIRQVDMDTLATIGDKVDLSRLVAINMATAHPHVDPDGSVYNMATSFGRNGKYHIIKIPNGGGGGEQPLENMSIVASVPMKRPLYPSYYHSFSITDNYFILIEQPLVMSVPTMTISPLTGHSFSECMSWTPAYKTRFHLIRRSDGQLVDNNIDYVADESFAFFHTINAYEDDNGNQLVIDICCYPDGNIISALSADNFRKVYEKGFKFGAESNVRRFVLPLQMIDHKNQFTSKSGNNNNKNLVTLTDTKAEAYVVDRKKSDGESLTIVLKPDILTKSGIFVGELARINYLLNGKKYRYFYSLYNTGVYGNDIKVKLMKFDTKTNEPIFWSEDNTQPSEPIFIEKPGVDYTNPDNEDNGVVVASVLSELDERDGFLLILDGKTFNELGRASFRTPSSIPGTFHGYFAN